jgi:hypothetical protein
MKKICTVFLLGIVVHSLLQSQTVSPLFQVMSSNSLINRPEVFRDLQVNIENVVGKTKPGLQLNILYQQLSDVRRSLTSAIKAPFIDKKMSEDLEKTYLSFTIEKGKDPFALIEVTDKDITLNDVLNSLKSELANELDSVMKKTLPSNRKEREAVCAALLVALEETGVSRNVSTTKFEESYVDKLAKTVAGILIREVKNKIHELYPDRDLLMLSLSPDSLKMYAQNALNMVTEKVKALVSESLDMAEYETSKAIDEFSRKLISGNIGLAATQGEGAFSGGITLSFINETKWQVGLYVNGQFNQGDTGSMVPKQSLIGFQVRHARDPVQMEFLGSVLFGDKNIHAWHAWEAGAGLSFRSGNEVVLGAAYFGMYVDKIIPSVHSVGLTIKGTSAESPGLLVGISIQQRDVHPLIQIGFPVLPSR